jgi:hypothetical protein
VCVFFFFFFFFFFALLCFALLCFRVLEISSRAALQRYKGHILFVAGLGFIQHVCVMLGIRALWTVGVTTRRLARVAGAADSKAAF